MSFLADWKLQQENCQKSLKWAFLKSVKSFQGNVFWNIVAYSQSEIACSKLTKKNTLKQGVKYIQS